MRAAARAQSGWVRLCLMEARGRRLRSMQDITFRRNSSSHDRPRKSASGTHVARGSMADLSVEDGLKQIEHYA